MAQPGTGMIYLGMSPWDGMWKNRHHLMSRFALGMPVLYVEPWQGLRKIRRSLLRGRGGVTQLNWSSVRRQSGNLYVFHSPAQYPVSGSKVLGPFTQRRWYSAVRSSARKIGITNPILWISRPEMVAAVGAFDECLSIYHVVDEYAGYTRQGSASTEKLVDREQRLLDAVDLSIVVSPELLESKAGTGRQLRIVENGVDIAPYDDRRDVPLLPDDLSNVSRPILGYCGLIGKRLDLDLLLELARSKPAWSLVLVGKVDERGCRGQLAALRELGNVHFLGEKPHETVPDYVSAIDLGLLPYRLNLETRNISPLKMYEYLAAGLPVVSTRIPAVERAAPMVSISDDASEFVSNCENLLDAEPVERRERRIQFARANTWEARVEQIWEILAGQLDCIGPVEAVHDGRD